jgi:hypothetical protein
MLDFCTNILVYLENLNVSFSKQYVYNCLKYEAIKNSCPVKVGEGKYHKEGLISNRKGFLYPAARLCILNRLWQADYL